jgi:hypothetical protein
VFSKLLQIITPQYKKSLAIFSTAAFSQGKDLLPWAKDAFIVSILDA